jgi:hypothetical protein
MTEIEIAWLAGLLEGEGCFFGAHNGKRSRGINNSCKVYLSMTDLDVVKKAGGLIGVEVRSYQPNRPNSKMAHRLQIHGDKAVSLMQAILPFMGERRSKKIQELLERAKNRLSPSERGRRATHFGMSSRERGIRSAQARAVARRDNHTLSLEF